MRRKTPYSLPTRHFSLCLEIYVQGIYNLLKIVLSLFFLVLKFIPKIFREFGSDASSLSDMKILETLLFFFFALSHSLATPPPIRSSITLMST